MGTILPSGQQTLQFLIRRLYVRLNANVFGLRDGGSENPLPHLTAAYQHQHVTKGFLGVYWSGKLCVTHKSIK